MEPSSDASPSQATPTATTEPVAQAAQAVPTAHAEVPPLPPKGKGNFCTNRKKSIA